MTDDDLEFSCRVYGSTRAEELAAGTNWTDEQKDAFVRQQFQAQHAYYHEHYHSAEYLVLECDGVPVGRLYVARWDDEIRVMDVALLNEHRGRGLGTIVLRELQDEGRRAGKPVRIHVERFNPALRLYERLGFRPIADKGVYLFLEWSPDSAPSPSQPA